MCIGLTAAAQQVPDLPVSTHSTIGLAAGLSGASTLPNGTTATTQANSDSSNNVATTQFVKNTVAASTSGVASISVTTANGISGTSSGGSTPALTLTLGAITPTSVASSGPITQGGTAVCLANGSSCPTSATGYSLGGTISSANVSLGSGAGSGASLVSASGTDASHIIIIQAGSSPSGGNPVYTLNFTTNRGHVPACLTQVYQLQTNSNAIMLGYFAQTSITTAYGIYYLYNQGNPYPTFTQGAQYEFVVSCP